MNFEHIAIYVNDLEVEKDFFIKYFGAKTGEKFQFPNGFTSYVLVFDNGLLLEIWQMHVSAPNYLPMYSGTHHIAINVGNKKAVDDLTRLMEDDGVYIVAAPRKTGDGYYAGIVADPEDNEIEILAGDS